MFVTIILTGFHMFCLHLFVQDVVLQVFLLKCEITVSSVSSKHASLARPGLAGTNINKHKTLLTRQTWADLGCHQANINNQILSDNQL